MAASFDRKRFLTPSMRSDALAIEAKSRLDIAVYGGSALMLASNFRFGAEDVDVAERGHAGPDQAHGISPLRMLRR